MTDIKTDLIDHPAAQPQADHTIISRRGAWASAAAAVGALVAAPAILTATTQPAEALLEPFLSAEVKDVLNFALTLEYLEAEFYSQGIAAGVVPSRYRAVFDTLALHENEHVGSLKVVLGFAAVGKPKFDFTAGGRYPDVFSNFNTFARLAQTFEDLGVSAYKGQATRLMGNSLILTTALRIHSLEGRHAAEVRRVRGVRPWDGGAFDRPRTKAQVLAMASPFIVAQS